MKKYSLYLLMAVVGLLTTACTEDFKDWNEPQSYGAETAITVPGVTASSTATIDLNKIEESATVQLFSLAAANVAEDITLGNARIILCPDNEEFADETIELNTDIEGNYEGAGVLQSIVKEHFGLRPVERTYEGLVLVNAIKDGQAILINAGAVKVGIIPQAPEIESAYYITGSINGWNNTDETYMLSNGDVDPYENSVFSVTIPGTVVGEGFEFKVTPKSGLGGDWSKCLAAGDGDGLPGKFYTNNEGGNLQVVGTGATFYTISFDMMEGTWKVESKNFAEFIYEIGNSQGWSSCVPMRDDTGKGKYRGFAYLDGEFKFKPNEGNWEGDWGQDPNGAQGALVQEGESNCGPVNAGFYMMDVDLAGMTWSVTEVNTISIVGNAVNGDEFWGTDYDMTYVKPDGQNEGYWQITCDLTNGNIKFRMNHNWDVNWGGTPDNANYGGENIPITAGNYTIKLWPVCETKSRYSIVKN